MSQQSHARMACSKNIHTIVLDTGSIIKNEPSASTLLNQAESIVTVPAIIAEIKDLATRARYETTLQPFVTIRSPQPSSIKFVTDFARKTGDLAVLSRPDIQIIALTYELECERNGGDWRLRRAPGQKGTNGPPPTKRKDTQPESSATPDEQPVQKDILDGEVEESHETSAESTATSSTTASSHIQEIPRTLVHDLSGSDLATVDDAEPSAIKDSSPSINSTNVQESNLSEVAASQAEIWLEQDLLEDQDGSESDSDADGWITPTNLKKRQAIDAASSTKQANEPTTVQVAVVTTDYAMQNVILQMNLNLLSPSMYRVKRLNTYVLRCHACFQMCKDLTKQFCPRCGQATLTRVSCSTSASGEFKLHLKKNMQWNHRGDRYSIPKPVHGSSNGRIKGGGKGGWGNDLMLTEDQKEYQSANREQQRQKEKNLMDDDYLPSILSGARSRAGGRIKVGAGRNVNSRKR